MIFVTLGSQKFQFDRLLKMIDELVVDDIIREKVFAQIGYSSYIPQNFEYKKFLSHDEFLSKMTECSKVITHGGTGAIITAVKNGKRVIAMARRAEFGEHVDDHQTQLVNEFSELKLIIAIESLLELKTAFENISDMHFEKYTSNTIKIISSLEKFVKSEFHLKAKG